MIVLDSKKRQRVVNDITRENDEKRKKREKLYLVIKVSCLKRAKNIIKYKINLLELKRKERNEKDRKFR